VGVFARALAGPICKIPILSAFIPAMFCAVSVVSAMPVDLSAGSRPPASCHPDYCASVRI